MGTTNKTIRTVGTFIVAGSLVFVGYNLKSTTNVYLETYPNEGRLFITAGHIPPSEVQDMERIYLSPYEDYAIYIQNTYEPKELKLRTQVIIGEDIKGTVVYSDSTSFTVKVEDWEDIQNGISGLRVTDSLGNPIGFVSSVIDFSEISCVRF